MPSMRWGVKSVCRDSGVRLAVENCYRGDEFFLDGLLDVFEPEFLGFASTWGTRTCTTT